MTMVGAAVPAAIALPPVGIGLAAGAATVAAANVIAQRNVKKKYACCDEEEDSLGCQLRYRLLIFYLIYDHQSMFLFFPHSCCNTNTTGCERKYSCCGGDENSAGCQKVCDHCYKEWGTKPDNCGESRHKNVVSLAETKEMLLF